MKTLCLILTASLVSLHPLIAAAEAHETSSASPVTTRDGFTFAAGGDLLGYYHPVTAQEDPELKKISDLFRQSDVGYANREGNVFDLATFKGAPGAETGGFEQMGVGGGPLATASTASDMKRFGLSLLSLANNHALDWGVDGLFATQKVLDEAGIVHAGTGYGRAQARAPAYVTTRGGRIALVSTASTFLPAFVAGPGRGNRGPRPGLSALRNSPVTLVSAEEFKVLKAIAERQGQALKPTDRELALDPNSAPFINQVFRMSVHSGLDYVVNNEDRQEILDAIRTGKRSADLVAFSIHAHETANGAQEHLVDPASLKPAGFLKQLFHEAIDAGADIVLTTGPHTLRGIEIYKGRPIFYGLGSLFFEIRIPGFNWPPEWYESVLAISRFADGQVTEIRLYPLVLRQEGQVAERSLTGSPRLARGAEAQRILDYLQQQSAAYGTHIDIVGDIGFIRVAAKQ